MATDGINLLTMLLIAAFATDGVSAGILFLLEMVAALADPDEPSAVGDVAEGRSNRDISQELRLSEHTVRNYLFRIYNKLGVSTRLELAVYALNQRETGQSPSAPNN